MNMSGISGFRRNKFAFLSHVVPPSWSGQAVVINRLLQELDPDCYCLISRQNFDRGDLRGDPDSGLRARYHYLPPEAQIWGSRRHLFVLNSWLQTLQRARRVLRILKGEGANAIVACSGDLFDPPAAYLASRWARVGYYLYFFDDYLYQWVWSVHRWFVRCFEPILLKNADGVVVPNEFLRDTYKQRYGIQSEVIHNPGGKMEFFPEQKIPWPAQKEEIQIVYTGAIYHAHYDAFRNLLTAIREISRPKIRMHFYTAQRPEDVEKENIYGPVLYHHHLPQSRIQEVQQRADLLFLPLAFRSPISEVIRTSAPGKMGDYLATGRPILVHAPADSFLSWYFKKHECGSVVDRSEPAELAQAIGRIIENPELRDKMGKKALERAQTDFNLACAREKFKNLVERRMGR